MENVFRAAQLESYCWGFQRHRGGIEPEVGEVQCELNIYFLWVSFENPTLNLYLILNWQI